jgi:hypothetical protein
MNSKRLLLAGVLVVFSLVACSKDGGEQQRAKDAGPTISQTLLESVPAGALVVNTFDLSSPGYQKIKAGPYKKFLQRFQQSPLASLSGDPSLPEAKALVAIVSAAQEARLLPSYDSTTPEVVQGLVGFITTSPATTAGATPHTEIAYYFKGAAGADLTERLSALAAALEKSGLTVERSSRDGLSRLTVKLPSDNSDGSTIIGTLHAFASKDKLAVASSEGFALRFFAAPTSDTFIQSPQFRAAAEFLPIGSDTLVGMSYLDLKNIGSSIASSIPETEREQFVAGIKALPVEGVVGYLEMRDVPVLKYAAPLAAQSPEQQQVIQSLQMAKAPALFGSSPANPVILLSLDGGLVQRLKQAALQGMPDAPSTPIVQQLSMLDGLSNIGLGIANSSGASPFPEVFLLGNSDKAAAVAKNLQSLAQSLTASSGVPSTPWQQKTIGGVAVDYMLSPFGIGIYVGAIGSTVFVASSEGMVNAILDASTTKAPSLAPTLEGLGKNGVISAHLNFARLYDLITAVQGTLAMFTGGQGVNAAEYEGLKDLGSLSAMITTDVKAVHLEARLNPS